MSNYDLLTYIQATFSLAAQNTNFKTYHVLLGTLENQ